MHRSKGASLLGAALCVLSLRLGSCFTTSSAGASRQTATALRSASVANKDKVACIGDVDVRRRTRSDEMEKVTAQRVSARGRYPVEPVFFAAQIFNIRVRKRVCFSGPSVGERQQFAN